MLRKTRYVLGVISVLIVVGIAFGVFVVLRSNTVRVPAGSLEAPVAQAAVTHDWARVAELLAPVDEKTFSAVLRLVKGHACLSINNDNDALKLFLSAGEDASLKEWLAWADKFAKLNPRQPVAHYFLGDAFARLGQWDSAIKSFSQALLGEKEPLALNGRGTVYAAKGEWDRAITDFEEAIKASPGLADAYASRGSLNIHKKTAFEGAIVWFDKALSISPDYALAHYNRALAKGAQGEWEKSRSDIEISLKKLGNMQPLLQKDLDVLINLYSSQEELAAGSEAGEQVGTTIGKYLDQISKGNINALNPLARQIGRNPELSNYVNRELNAIARANPVLGQKINNKILSGRDWTSPIGGGTHLLNLASGLQWGGTAGQRGRIEGGLGLGPWAQGHLDKQAIDNKGWNALKLPGASNPAGGVTMSLASAHVEKGDWPIVPRYGLLYPISSSEVRTDRK